MATFLESVSLLVVGAALSFAAAWYWFSAAERRRVTERTQFEHAQLLERVSAIETQIALVGQAVLPISTAFQAILVKELTHFHTPEMDSLMAQLGPPYTLTMVDERRLTELLIQREIAIDHDIGESERDAAHMLPLVMKRVRLETESLGGVQQPVNFKLVTVVAPIYGPK